MSKPPPDSTATALRFASALSERADAEASAEEVAQELGERLAAPVDLLVIFATPHHAEALERVRERLSKALSPRVELGVTAEGVIGRRREVEREPGVSVFAASLPGARLRPFSYEEIDWPAVVESPDALRRLIAVEGAPPRAVLFLADPFSTPMVKLLPAMNAAFPGVPVVGGMASGGREPGGNRLLIDGQVHRQGAVGVAIGGAVRADCTVSQGCRAIGRPLVITRSRRHIVQELGGRRALDALQEVLHGLPPADRALIESHGLLVGRVINEYKDRFGRGDFLIKNLLGLDAKAGYLAINDAQLRVGQTIQFHVRDRRTATEDFELMLQAQKLHGPGAGALLFSCNGRGSRLFDEANVDAELVHAALGDVPLAGFFAAGELGPVGGQNFLHGHTASLVVFRPEE